MTKDEFFAHFDGIEIAKINMGKKVKECTENCRKMKRGQQTNFACVGTRCYRTAKGVEKSALKPEDVLFEHDFDQKDASITTHHEEIKVERFVEMLVNGGDAAGGKNTEEWSAAVNKALPEGTTKVIKTYRIVNKHEHELHIEYKTPVPEKAGVYKKNLLAKFAVADDEGAVPQLKEFLA